MPDYGNPSYWDERYSARNIDSFDWYQNYDLLRPILKPLLSTSADFEILIPGCGNSPLAAQMSTEGFRNITCIDGSTVVIQQMQERYQNIEDLEFISADCCHLDFVPEGSFDFILDKALLDSLLCGGNSFKRSAEYVSEMYRILKPGGSFVVVSHGGPATRMNLLVMEDRKWTVQETRMPKSPVAGNESKSEVHFVYKCSKN